MTATHAAPLLYTGLCGLLLFALSVRVTLMRRRLGVSLGTGGDPTLERLCRVQANFAEYAPLFLLALAGLAYAGTPAPTIHVLGIAFVAGRVIHAWALMQQGRIHAIARPLGMTLTWVPLVAASLMLVAIWAGRPL